ncbi:MAG: helix-turn-helix transcriptional regulator [Hyphomicrobiales bacterium]|nr:helix-turn-helix transcriptional regulator [Hyphomicrobiales bacterium]
MDSELLRRHIGALIKARRKRLKITQESLAARMGMSRAALANIETGRQNMLLHHLYRFADNLKLKVTDLLPEPALLESAAEPDDLPLPENLSRAQRAQVARLMRDDTAADGTEEDGDHGPRKKTQSRKGSTKRA